MILGLTLALRLLFGPCFFLALRAEKSASGADQPPVEFGMNPPTKIKVEISFVRKWLIKIGMSLLVLSQCESYIYAASSIRVRLGLLDILAYCLNIAILVGSLVWLFLVSRKPSEQTFQLIRDNFLHYSDHLRGQTPSERSDRCSYPVILIQNVLFLTKTVVIIISSYIHTANVYAFCSWTVLTSVVQFIVFKRNPHYHREVVLYQVSACLAVAKSLLLIFFQLWPQIMKQDGISILFVALVISFILTEFMAVIFLWIRVFRTWLATKKNKSNQVQDQSEKENDENLGAVATPLAVAMKPRPIKFRQRLDFQGINQLPNTNHRSKDILSANPKKYSKLEDVSEQINAPDTLDSVKRLAPRENRKPKLSQLYKLSLQRMKKVE